MQSTIAKRDALIVMMTLSMLGMRVWPSMQAPLRVLMEAALAKCAITLQTNAAATSTLALLPMVNQQ
jgi:hypothetical protein